MPGDGCTALHYTALHCTALHCTALHCTALHCTALHCTALHCTALHCTALDRVAGDGGQIQIGRQSPHTTGIRLDTGRRVVYCGLLWFVVYCGLLWFITGQLWPIGMWAFRNLPSISPSVPGQLRGEKSILGAVTGQFVFLWTFFLPLSNGTSWYSSDKLLIY